MPPRCTSLKQGLRECDVWPTLAALAPETAPAEAIQGRIYMCAEHALHTAYILHLSSAGLPGIAVWLVSLASFDIQVVSCGAMLLVCCNLRMWRCMSGICRVLWLTDLCQRLIWRQQSLPNQLR